MWIDGVELVEGSNATNFTIASGDSTAQSALIPTIGELFFRSDLDQLQVYLSGGWSSTGGDIGAHAADLSLHITSTQNTLLDGLTVLAADLNDVVNKAQASHNHTGVYEPADNTILKDADIGVSVAAFVHNHDAAYVNVGGDTMTGNLTMTSGATVTGIPTPVNATEAASKSYVDAVAQGLAVKPAAIAATTGNLTGTYQNGTLGVGATLNLGPAVTLTIDTVSITAQFDGILVKNQTNAAHNGRYFVSQVGGVSTDWILTRCTYCDEATEIPSSFVYIQGGSQIATGWAALVENPSTFTVGTDDVTYTQFSGAGTYTAGSGLTLTGNQFAVDAAGTLTLIKTVDGTTSGLDADLLDGLDSTAFALSGHNHDATYVNTSGDTMTGNLKTLTVSETVNVPTISAGALTLNLALANVFEVSVNANITSLTISNPPTTGTAFSFVLKMNLTGSFTVTWPASIKWPGGTAPTLTTTASKVDTFVLYTVDGGTSYFGFTAGQNS